MQSSRKATNLQIAAFVVAIFRYMGMGGMAIGHNVFESYWYFVAFEIISWGAMAVLEGFAMPFISKGMRQFPINSFYWWQLLVYRIVLLAAIPLLGAPLYAAVSRSSSIEGVLAPISPLLFWLWLLLFSGLVALIVDAVGIVDELQPIKDELKPDRAQLKTEAWGMLSLAYSKNTWVYPPTLVKLMGERITEAEAVAILGEWYEAMVPKRPGQKSRDEQAFIEVIQPVSLNGRER